MECPSNKWFARRQVGVVFTQRMNGRLGPKRRRAYRNAWLGDTLIGTLRKLYGASFAQGCTEGEKLTDVLDTLDDLSLIKLARDHAVGKLEQFCYQAA